ncbi:GntR family transcriptional regulator [Nesterenkonia sp. MY13]|uniref:GntR family transcriptional regulator n=1 Tax=Nesterenkonia sedimenti TaxID=1463632 RepID=A0A7X8TJ36_9MICC|nr:GntR family transcriptional regulator [Nesterenkonia sedimenti]NLS09681.1 GntR family transcriptional regulator [Nesterenkonia sedimenti]
MAAHEIPLSTIQQYKSLRATVTEALRTAIIVGDLEEGELYSAPALAEPLGVSATPVREAMMDLANDGLVTPVKNKGFRVTDMTVEELRQVTAVRQLLEGPATRAVVGKIPKDAFPALRAKAEQMNEAAAEGDLRTYLVKDREFHADILEYTGNKRLVDLCTRLRGQTRLRALRPLAETGKLVHSAQEHLELLDRISEGDADGAYAVIMRHLGHASQLWSEGTEGKNAEAITPLLYEDLPE